MTCTRCGVPTCEHHELIARALGLEGLAICFACLAGELAIPADELADATLGYVTHRDCYLDEWREIGRCALGGEGVTLPCLPVEVPDRFAALAGDPDRVSTTERREAPTSDEAAPPSWGQEETFDGGDAGCGDLVFDLRIFFRTLQGGTRALVIARDPGAPIDLPAWCRITGNRLEKAAHPHYLIEKKKE